MIEPATSHDIDAITRMTRAMVDDMAAYGGHAVTSEHASWQELSATVSTMIANSDYRYLIGKAPDNESTGFIGGEIIRMRYIWKPKTMLHISALYVRPQYRRRGIAQALLLELIEWGRAKQCTQADLNVLYNNPAVTLYEKLGFRDFERKLICKLD